MKLLSFIFAIYVLTLNTFPCTDTVADNAQSQVLAASGLDHDRKASDLCPPFCTCHCCHVHTVEFRSVTFKPFYTKISSKIFLHFEGVGEESLPPLLDPPRV